ncbi:hypothetical protein SLA2020_275080 [Shorea laevis]
MDMSRMMNHGTRCLKEFTRIWTTLQSLFDLLLLFQCLLTLSTCGEEVLGRLVPILIQTATCLLCNVGPVQLLKLYGVPYWVLLCGWTWSLTCITMVMETNYHSIVERYGSFVSFLPMFKYRLLKDSDVPGVVARSMLVHIGNCFLMRHYNKEKEMRKDGFCLL